MSYYRKDEDGNFKSKDEFDEAKENGDIKGNVYGLYWDPVTGKEYWPDGTVKP